ncbi:MAG: NAD/NADP octopine/nopaline dehydrogenase family protein [bacterium]|nr:NAD/NADP octopine/nopaline dehydrogenase family protein [bacterium]
MNQFKPKFCVLGAGHGGTAMAGHLSLMGFEVNIYNRTEERLWPIKARGGIEVLGEVEGFAKIKLATSEIEKAIQDVDILMVVVPATGHRFMAEVCAPFLKDGQIIILNPGRTFGAIEFSHVIKSKGCIANVIVAEAQTLIYASRMINPGQAKIFRIKNSIPVASIKAFKIPQVLKAIYCAYPQFVPGDNVFKTSLDNIGAVFHPAITILNTGWIEDVSEFQFYLQGCTPSVATVLEKMDAERVAVAAALGIRATTARDWLYLAYDATGKNLHDAMQANPGYREIMAPTTLNIRYITEDVPMSLVPIASIGDMLGVPTLTIKAIIHLASVMHGVDYWKEGRTVDKLGIAGMSVKELRLLAIGEENRP